MKPGIYIEAKKVRFLPPKSVSPAYSDKWHLYLVYRDGAGNERVIRGGPPDNDLLDGITGEIEIQADIPLAESYDAYEGDAADQRPMRRLPVLEKNLEQVWAAMTAKAKNLEALKLEYNNVNPQNSNSVINAILKGLGVDIHRYYPPGLTKKQLHGVGNDMSDPVQDRPKASQPLPPARPRSEKHSSLAAPARTETAPLNPVSKALLERTRALGQSPGEIMAKGVGRVTEPEVRTIVGHPDYWPSIKRKLRPAAQSLPDFAGAWFDRAYNDLPPGAAPRIPATVSPALSPDGALVSDGLQRVASVLGQGVNEPAAPSPFGADLSKPVQALQRTLNNIAGDGFAAPLKEDGVLGPKTNDRLRDVLTFKGRAPVLSGLQKMLNA